MVYTVINKGLLAIQQSHPGPLMSGETWYVYETLAHAESALARDEAIYTDNIVVALDCEWDSLWKVINILFGTSIVPVRWLNHSVPLITLDSLALTTQQDGPEG